MITAVRGFKMLAAAVILTLGFTGCGGDNGAGPDTKPDGGGGGSTGGTITLTNIPAKYNGKYALFYTDDLDKSQPMVLGAQSINLSTEAVTLSPISNGSVSLPMWVYKDGNLGRYYGNDVISMSGNSGNIVFFILGTETATLRESFFNSNCIADVQYNAITFANGGATVSWSNARYIFDSGDKTVDPNLIGKWQFEFENVTYPSGYEFTSNHATSYSNGSQNSRVPAYTENNRIYAPMDSNLTYSINGNKLTLNADTGGSPTLTFNKVTSFSWE